MQILSKIPVWAWTFIIGFVIALLIDGCGETKTETITVEKPTPKIEYVDRWKTDTLLRFAYRESRIDTIIDTLTHEVIEVRLDTLLKVDTLKIVETWLTELVKYDTTLTFDNDAVNIKWQNYQNLTENLQVTLLSQTSKRLGLIMYAKAGINSDFNSIYKPVIGGGLLFDKKRFIFGPDYSYNGQHNINVILGYRLR